MYLRRFNACVSTAKDNDHENSYRRKGSRDEASKGSPQTVFTALYIIVPGCVNIGVSVN